MSGRAEPSAEWWESEQEYDDAVIEAATMGQSFERSASANRDQPAQRYKGGIYDRSLVSAGVIDASEAGQYAQLTYDEMQQIVHTLAAGIRTLGIEPGERVAVFSDTRMEWAQVDFALLMAGAVVTTVYTESSTKQMQYLLSDSGAVGLIVENEELLERVLTVEGDLDLRFLIVMDDSSLAETREDILTLGALYRRGEQNSQPSQPETWLSSQSTDDLATIIYTSGTTGQPKGVKLTHQNLQANVSGIRKRGGPRPDKPDDMFVFDEDTTSLSFLPLAHVFERTVGHFTMFASGGTVAYAESPETVAEDIRKIRPDGLTSVPRVYERIYDSMQEQAQGSRLKEHIFDWALGVAREHSQRSEYSILHRLKHALADRLVYSTVREELGGGVDGFISGGGSLSMELSQLFDGMGLTIYEGYGLTEAAPVVSVNPIEEPRPGTLGPPLPGVEVSLDDSQIDESRKQHSTSEIGELLVRGANVTGGYWQDPHATETAFTEDGWFRTGDIVELTDDGYLIFHDRLKQLLVLSTGKNVAPEPIENAFATSDRVEQIMIIGDNEKFISALIVPNFEEIRRWADREGIRLPSRRERLCHDKRVQRWIVEEVNAVNRRFQSEEQIKLFELVPERWTPQNGLLTPSLKKKRRAIVQRYEERIADLYSEG
ncbi:AMP-dependent synthetase/ligase [Halocatena pleomorpha]|uniref:Long-chain fatty acid--CoA ligase n=1 Tax=Halocatena pleomorpha TaxID=1785090 RepID=A0A3P3R8E6_9EURY|nr:long-chain fatty acid--CoA ligase [Halocatena pleomorpha]RRJ29686.1 long-chain fatty acid--CoA ligase [Halocatena pleomorpha]